MSSQKKALITGITGQDGSHLAELLLQKNYEVYGMHRRTSTPNFQNIQHIQDKINLVCGELTDGSSIHDIIKEIQPDEVYNLGAQSHVKESEKQPIFTFNTNALGVVWLIEAIKKHIPATKFYQASTSEMFGNSPPKQNENTLFDPRSPYAEAKLWAHKQVVQYRNEGIFAVGGILFNHEGPRRGEAFVSRKITTNLAQIKLGLKDNFELGNLDAKRDWGYAGDYVKAMQLMLQQQNPSDYVISTGEAHTVREFIKTTAETLDMKITFEGKDLNEAAYWNDKKIITINPKYFRIQEVNYLCGDSSKAKKELNWTPEITFTKLAQMMALSDLQKYSKQ